MVVPDMTTHPLDAQMPKGDIGADIEEYIAAAIANMVVGM